MPDVRRREFMTLLGGVTVAWPLAVRAQQTAMPVIGLLVPASTAQVENINAVRQGLNEVGFVEGQTSPFSPHSLRGSSTDCPGWQRT